jgi:hypothetical protein
MNRNYLKDIDKDILIGRIEELEHEIKCLREDNESRRK